MTAIAKKAVIRENITSYQIARRRRNLLLSAAVTLLAIIILSAYIMPLVFGVTTSLKTKAQASDPSAPLLPSDKLQFEYEGEEYDVFKVPTDTGIQEWALIQRRRRGASIFVDIHDPTKTPIEWEGNTHL